MVKLTQITDSSVKKLYQAIYEIGLSRHIKRPLTPVIEKLHSWLEECGYHFEFVAVAIKDEDLPLPVIKSVSYSNGRDYIKKLKNLSLPKQGKTEIYKGTVNLSIGDLSYFIDSLQRVNSQIIPEVKGGKVIIAPITFLGTTIEIIFGLENEEKFKIGELELLSSVIFPVGTYLVSLWLNNSTLTELHRNEKIVKGISKLEEQKDEFISMAAHELLSPMSAIKGYLSMVIEGDTGDINEKARGFLADANSINDRMIRLVNNMLNVSRIEEQRMIYQTEYENLSNIVNLVFHQFIPEAERKGLDFQLRIPHELKDRVYVDPDKINEVIGNLISNAVKYTDNGTIVVRLTQPNSKIVRFEVEDSGVGISKEEQNKLFRKFYRIESNVGKTTGSGLGLYISKLLIEKFNGRIGLKSDIGKGSTFWFELPLVT